MTSNKTVTKAKDTDFTKELIAAGAIVVLAVAFFLVVWCLRLRKRKKPSNDVEMLSTND